MPILETFCDAIESAIQAYENEAENVPAHRRTSIQALRQRLLECKRDKIDSVEFRIEIVDYVHNIPAGVFAFIPAFDSRFRKHLLVVLAESRFSEQQLTLRERTQDRDSQREEVNRMNVRINELTQQLAEERAKNNVQRVNQLTEELALEKQKNQFLSVENRRLEQEVSNVNQQLTNVQKDYDVLKTQYDELVKEKGNAPIGQNIKSSNVHSPFFT